MELNCWGFFYKFHINFQAFPFPVQSFCYSVLVCYQIFSKKVSMLSLLKDHCAIFFSFRQNSYYYPATDAFALMVFLIFLGYSRHLFNLLHSYWHQVYSPVHNTVSTQSGQRVCRASVAPALHLCLHRMCSDTVLHCRSPTL